MSTWSYNPRTGAVRRVPLRIAQICDESPVHLRYGAGWLIPAGEPYLVEERPRYSVVLDTGHVLRVDRARFDRTRRGLIARMDARHERAAMDRFC